MKFKRMAAAATALVASAGMLLMVGCGENIDPSDPQTLQVYVYNAGYGYQWCVDILDAFQEEEWVQEKYPELYVDFDRNELDTFGGDQLSRGESNDYDLIFGQGLNSYMGPSGEVLDLTESVYESEVPGEDITVAVKMNDSYLISSAYNDIDATADPRYYMMPYAEGMTGIVYNETILTALGFSVPNTTDELISIMAEVKAMNGENETYPYTTSFLTYGASTYVSYLINTLWAQYEGSDEYINFFNGIDSDTNSMSPAIFSQEGRLEALKVIEGIMAYDNGYTVSAGTDRAAYMTAQTQLLMGTYGLFMANGDWYDNEMRTTAEGLGDRAGVIKMMKTPIISAIRSKTPSITSDEMLSDVVEAIDRGATSYDGVDNTDFQTVLKARTTIYSIGPGHTAVIPKHAAAQEVAVDFLRYMATDKANAIYCRATRGASLPFNYDPQTKDPELFGELSVFQQERLNYFYNYQTEITTLPAASSFPLVRYGGLSEWASCSNRPAYEIAQNGASNGNYDSLAERIYYTDIQYWTEDGNRRWNNCLSNAGY